MSRGRGVSFIPKSGKALEEKSKIESVVGSLAERQGLEVVECDLFRAGRKLILRVFVDKEGGVNLDDCQRLSRELGAALDLEDLIPGSYTLEVSSPGLDRPLRSTRDFLRQKGRTLRLGLSEAIGGRKALSGKLLDANDDAVTLEVARGKATETISVPRSAILHAKVETVF